MRTQKRRLCDYGGRAQNEISRCHKSSNMNICQKLEEARNGFLPIAYREDIALMISKFQSSGLRDCETVISIVLSNLVCSNLLLQPQESNTRTKTFFSFLSLFSDLIFGGLFHLFHVKFSCSIKLLEVVFYCSLDCFLPDRVFDLAFVCFSCDVFLSLFSTFLWLN